MYMYMYMYRHKTIHAYLYIYIYIHVYVKCLVVLDRRCSLTSSRCQHRAGWLYQGAVLLECGSDWPRYGAD